MQSSLYLSNIERSIYSSSHIPTDYSQHSRPSFEGPFLLFNRQTDRLNQGFTALTSSIIGLRISSVIPRIFIISCGGIASSTDAI